MLLQRAPRERCSRLNRLLTSIISEIPGIAVKLPPTAFRV